MHNTFKKIITHAFVLGILALTQSVSAATLSTPAERWVGVPQQVDASMQNLNIPADASGRGMWSAPFDWPMNGLHNMILPDGKVLTFGTNADGGAQEGRLFDVWDPNTGFGANSHNTTYQAQRQDSFCATGAYLNDGTLLISGGNANNGGFGNGSTIYRWTDNSSITDAAVLGLPRWYSTMITLPDSRKLMMGGMKPYTEGMYQDPEGAIARGEPSMTPEVYENGQWRSLFGANSRLAFGPDFLRTSFPHAFVAPNGLVFGLSADRMWWLDANANNGSGAVIDAGQFKPGQGFKADPDNVGALSVAVMYDVGKVIQVGGNGGFNGDGMPASNKATSIDINGGAPVLTELPRMNFPRRYGNGVVLANGEVVITGGTRQGNDAGGNEIYTSEIWNPNSNTWRTGADASTIRVYHSISSLLLNGAIISTGGGTPGPVLNKTGEVYYPPYLFEQTGAGSQLAQRPVIQGISGLKHTHGQNIQVDLASQEAISSLVFIGLSNGTHSFNNGQRRIPVGFVQEENRLTATVPNRNLTPPGYYQLVALNNQGVPSYGVVVAIGNEVAAPAVTTTTYDPTTNSDVITGDLAFYAKATVRFDNLAGGVWQRIFDYGDGPATNNIHLGQLADTNGMRFEFWREGVAYTLDVQNVITQGATDTYVAQITSAGRLQLYKNDALIGELQTPTVPEQVDRVNKLIGSSNWAADTDLIGEVIDITINEDGQPADQPPADAVACAVEGATCTIPANQLATVWYGADTTYVNQTGLTGTVDCSNAVFGDPLSGVVKACRYVVTGSTGPVDSDGDGVPDTVDAFPNDPNETKDSDGDGIGDNADPSPNGEAVNLDFKTPIIQAGDSINFDLTGAVGEQYSWHFGDGSPDTDYSANPDVSHTFSSPGIYFITLNRRDAQGIISQTVRTQAVATSNTAQRPNSSTAISVAPDGRIWTVNPDNDSVSVVDSNSNALLAEINVGDSPRTLAFAPNGDVWVSNKGSATISIINANSLTVVNTIALPRASQPHGLAFAPSGNNAYVVLEATGQLAKLDGETATLQGVVNLVPNVRHVAVTADSETLLVSRFITPPLIGESTLTLDTSGQGGEVLVINAGDLSLVKTIRLQHSDKTDTEIQGAGIPNYLAAPAISPDGSSAWVPSKQDNIKRGVARNGQNLDFQNTVRAISSKIDMGALTEDYAARVDHDNASLGSAAVYHPSGAFVFVALETSREVAVVNPFNHAQLFRIPVELAPQGLAISNDGNTLYVQNFMSRSVSVVDLTNLTQQGELNTAAAIHVDTVNNEALASQVLRGKQLFYDAADARLARDRYMSCATCHNDGGSDGRVWDFTGRGEGLRNTIQLNGRAAISHGFLHWSANFDELQDFEAQIRTLAGGTGLMADADFDAGTRSQPLGDPKAGLSADLDALAAYVASLNQFSPSPYRNLNGSLTASAQEGKSLFANQCSSCHGGIHFTNSTDVNNLRDIGTLKSSSGNRLGGSLTGIDVPTLRDIWQTAPYLHDGSANTLAEAINAHDGVNVIGNDMANLVNYLLEIGQEEAGAPVLDAPITMTISEPSSDINLLQGESYSITAAITGDTNRVSRVEVYNYDTVIATLTSAPYNLSGSTEGIPPGVYAIKAIAYDAQGVAIASSNTVNITVAADGDNLPPMALITTPSSDISLTQGEPYAITVEASDPDGTVNRVEFYNQDALFSTLTAAPYALQGSTSNIAPGVYTIHAKAYDNQGAVTTSDPVTITINAQ